MLVQVKSTPFRYGRVGWSPELLRIVVKVDDTIAVATIVIRSLMLSLPITGCSFCDIPNPVGLASVATDVAVAVASALIVSDVIDVIMVAARAVVISVVFAFNVGRDCEKKVERTVGRMWIREDVHCPHLIRIWHHPRINI